MDYGSEDLIYNCLFCNAALNEEYASTCENTDCQEKIATIIDDFHSHYDAYKTKATALNMPWATTMMDGVESIYNLRYMSESDMYYSLDSMKALYTQLEYMEKNMTTVPIITHADHTRVVDDLNSQILLLQENLERMRTANAQLTDSNSRMSRQIDTMATASSGNQAKFTTMKEQIERAKRENAHLLDQMRARERDLVQSSGEHEKILREVRQAYDTAVARSEQFSNQVEREKKKVTSLEEKLTRMEGELKEKDSRTLVRVTSTASPHIPPEIKPRAPTQNWSTTVIASVTTMPCEPINVNPGNGKYYHGPVARVIYNY
jgi:hypothetical protein